MNSTELKGKMLKATKWATITEIAAKIVNPITNMILARLIIPEAFGVVVTVTMIISFADMFTDAGFQKYLVQHEFKNEKERFDNTNVAFWTNLAISLFLWGIIILFCEPIASMVGNPGLGIVIVIACVELPLTSFSSIQMALYRRDFDFKTLFLIRIVSAFMPFIISIPLAFFGFSYWALIIGNLCVQLYNAVILTVKSKWKPQLFYRMKILKEMLSFSIWSLLEAVSIWLTSWVDSLIIGNVLSSYYLGVYRTSLTTVNGLMSVITAITVPVLFSALSRLQNNNEEFNHIFLKTQRVVSILLFPLGIGVYLYSTIATQILLGSQWIEASGVIGQWALTSSIMIVFSHYCSEVYRAKGLPKLSLLAHILHLVVLIPVCIISSQYGFITLIYARSWIRMQSVLVDFLIMKIIIGIPIFKIIGNVFPTAVSAIFMGFFGYFLKQLRDGVMWNLASIVICIFFYIALLFTFKSMRMECIEMIKELKKKYRI